MINGGPISLSCITDALVSPTMSLSDNLFDWLIDWLILTTYKPVLSYFMPRGERIAFIVRPKVHLLVWFSCLGFMAYQPFVGYLTPNLFYANSRFSFKQFSLKWVHSLSKTFLYQNIQFIQTVLIQLIQFSISTDFVYTQLNVKTVLY